MLGEGVMMSGLNGKALESGKYWPTKQEVFKAIPAHLLKRDTGKSMAYALSSLAITAACFAVGTAIPAEIAWAPAWLVYAVITGGPLWDDLDPCATQSVLLAQRTVQESVMVLNLLCCAWNSGNAQQQIMYHGQNCMCLQAHQLRACGWSPTSVDTEPSQTTSVFRPPWDTSFIQS